MIEGFADNSSRKKVVIKYVKIQNTYLYKDGEEGKAINNTGKTKNIFRIVA